MAWEQNPYAVKVTLVAGADLSTKQFTFVKLDGNAITGTPSAISAAAATDYVIGVLQNQPKVVATGIVSGATSYNYGEAEVTLSGITKVVAGANNIGIGNRLSVDSSGRAVPVTAINASATKYIFGTALAASSATGDIITMVVNTAASVLGA
jgi:hypothetical protein